MERFIQLNLRSDPEKTVQANLPSAEHQEPDSSLSSKRLHRLLNRVAHKAAAQQSHKGTGLFCK